MAPPEPTRAGRAAPAGPASLTPSRAAPKPGAWRRWAFVIAVLVTLPVLLLGGTAAALWQGLHSEAGTRWWLQQAAQRVPGLQIEAPRGALLGPQAEFALDRLVLKAGRSTVRIDGLRSSGLDLSDFFLRAPFAHLQARALSAQRVDIETTPAPQPTPPTAAPADLRLPLTARIEALRIDELQLPGLTPPLRGLAASLEAGSTHRVDGLTLRWNGLAASGRLQIEAAAPMTLGARLDVRSETGPGAATADASATAPAVDAAALPAWARDVTLNLQAQGPLARIDTQAVLTMQAQRLDAHAQLMPFEALPVSQLQANFAQLDLARLLAPFDVAAAPTTALTGQVSVQLARGQPLEVQAQVRNEEPGRWDQRRAPLRAIDVLARGEGGANGTWQIERARLELASDAKTAAGVIEARGSYDAGRADATVQLEAVALQGLDERAPALLLNGALKLALSPPAAGAAPSTTAGGAGFGRLALEAQLSGRLTSTPGKAPGKTASKATSKTALKQTPPTAQTAPPATSQSRAAQAAAPLPTALRNAVQLAFKGQLDSDRLVVETLSARAGNARLDGKGSARREGSAWTASADLKLAAFDPSQWWPGEPGASWRRGPNVLNGQASLNARIPIAPETADTSRRAQPQPPASAPAWLAQLQGQLKAELTDSALAGQPLTLALQADADGRGHLAAQLKAQAADNRADLDLKLHSSPNTTSAAGQEEGLKLDIDAPALASLSGALQAMGAGPLAGKLRAQARADGPLGAWLFGAAAPGALVTKGSLSVDGLKAGTVQLEAAQGRWDLTLPGGGQANAPAARAAIQAQLDATRLQLPGLLVPTAGLQLEGTLADHRASLNATLRAVPTAATAAATSAATTTADASTASRAAAVSSVAGNAEPPAPGADPAGTARAREPAPLALQARMSGAWQAGEAGASLWRGRLQELSLRPTTLAKSGAASRGSASASASTAVAASAPPASAASATSAASAIAPSTATASTVTDPLALIVARDIDFELAQSPQSLRASLSPGQADVLGAVLRWTQARWERSGENAPRLDVQAQVEPFLVAQLLQRLQPDFGWQGDLRMGAKIEVRSAPAVTALVEITRSGGDLQVNELGSIQPLGLRELRLDLHAENGLWRMTQVIDGETLGRLAGAQTVRTDAQRMWPPDDAPVEGALRLQVEQLSTWGAWVPAGWRLGGAIDGVLRIAGRFGGPDLIGELSGQRLSLRNALEGVALSDGELDARFEGGTARLNTLRFKAGEGSLRASGDARLGADPRASLKLVAERATVLGRVDRRVVISGETAIDLDATSIKVDGSIRADEGQIDISSGDAPSLGDDVTVRRRGDPDRPTAEATPRPPRAVDLKLAVSLGDRFRLRGRGIDTRLEGDLKISTPNGKLVAYGEIRTERGTYEAYGQKLEIERGVITFVGDIGNPRLDISAIRANTDTRVGVNVGGSVVSPRIRLFSDPELPATDKLALLITGRSYDSLGGTESLLLQRAALALLAGEGGTGVGAFDAAKLFKLDELSVRQGDGAVRETVVSLGKQISDRVYVGYERGLNATAGNWQLIYRVAKRFTLRAQSGEDPAVDLIWVFRWN